MHPDLEDTEKFLAPPEEETLKYYAKRKLVVNWDDEEKEAIETVKAMAQETYLGIFGDTLELIQSIYESVKTEEGTENWGLLNSKQLESYILTLSEQRIATSLQVSSIRMEALFAKYSLDDDYHDEYRHATGTNNAREAFAHTMTINKRYSYFFRYYVHTMCETLAREIDALVKNLNSVLYRKNSNV